MSLFCFNSCNPSSSLTYVRATQNTEESGPLSTALKALHPVLSPLFEHSLLTHPLAPVNPSSQGLGVCRSFRNIFPAPSSPTVSQPSSRSGLKGRLLRGALQNRPPPPFPRFGPFPFFISLLSSYYSLERCWRISRGLATVSRRGCGPRRKALLSHHRVALRAPLTRLGPRRTTAPPAPLFTFRVGGRVRGGGAPLPGRGGRAGRCAVSRPVWSPAAAVAAAAAARRRHRPGSSTMSGEWRPRRCHPAGPPRLPPLQLHTPAPEPPRPARPPTPVPSLADPCVRPGAGPWSPALLWRPEPRHSQPPASRPPLSPLLDTCLQTSSLSQCSDPRAQSPLSLSSVPRVSVPPNSWKPPVPASAPGPSAPSSFPLPRPRVCGPSSLQAGREGVVSRHS